MRFFRYDIALLVIVLAAGASVVVAQHRIDARQRAAAAEGQTPLMAECPICKMQIQVNEKTPRYEHEGEMFYFMNEQMRQEFIAQVEGDAKARR